MTLQRLAMAFFKENKIPRIIKNEIIIFACPVCKNEAHMNAATTNWACQTCNEMGNISHLQKHISKFDTLLALRESKIYNPEEEKRKIKSEFKKLIDAAKNNSVCSHQSIEELQQTVNDLLTFYEQKLK
jgi:hypothetical protein